MILGVRERTGMMKRRDLEEWLTLVRFDYTRMIASSLNMTTSSALPLEYFVVHIELPSTSHRHRHRLDNEKGGWSKSRSSKTDRRLRRLEKTVESLSHGLIVALLQLRAGGEYAEQGRRGSGPGPLSPAPAPPRQSRSNVISDEIESASGDDAVDDNDSTAFAGTGSLENGTGKSVFVLITLDLLTMNMLCAAPGGNASPLRPNTTASSSPLEKNLLRLLRGTQLPSTVTSVASKAGPENALSCIATGSDGSLFTTSKEWSHIPRILSPILKFIASSEVSRFLKRAEIHAGLSNTQFFDLFWVLDNLFNVHGGVRLLFSLASRDRIVLIIGSFRF